MFAIEKTQEELTKDVEKLYNKPGKGKKEQDYLKHGAVALAMNKAFGPTGWDCVTEKIEIIKPVYRCNSGSKEDPAGIYFSAIASAVVTVRARSLFRGDGTFVEVVRTAASVGQAVGGKSTTEFDAIQNAITSAETAAFKRACRYFGPSTGLTLQFDPGEREAIQAQIEQANMAAKIEDGGATVVEGMDVPTEAPVPTQMSAPVQTTDPAHPTASATTQTPPVNGNAVHQSAPSNGTGHAVPDVLKNLQDQAALNRIATLASDATTVPAADMKALMVTLVSTFEKHGALGVWKAAGLPVGGGASVTRGCLNSLAQVLEEASVAPGGLEGFLAKFKPAAPTTAAPTTAAPTTAAASAPTATVIINGQHVAGPAPTVPAPGATVVEPSVSSTGQTAGQTMGEQLQQAWNDNELSRSERRERYQRRFGGSAPDVIQTLVDTPDDVEVSREVAGKIHAFGLSRYAKLNQPSVAFDLWKKVGYDFSHGQPKGVQVRAFADGLPD